MKIQWRQKHRVRWYIALTSSVLMITMLLWTVPSDGQTSSSNYPTTADAITVLPHRKVKQSSHKTILLWTGYFEGNDWGYKNFALSSCQNNCKITNDQSRIHESDAVVFNSRNLEQPFPDTRTPDQVWVLHNIEPPYFLFLDMAYYNGIFNWTSWYRRDADVYSPYGNFVKRTENVSLQNYFATKKKLSYWSGSNCYDKSSPRRYRLIAQLEKYLDIDTYGDCGRLKCSKSIDHECQKTFKNYKFVFAFENGNCRDYATEKFWGALAREQVPVVLGGADYEAIAPPGSFINVRDFKTVEDLANHLIRVGGSEELYNSYFAWRKHFELASFRTVNWCGLCAALHNSTKPAQVYTDLRKWIAADMCNMYSLWDMLMDRLARFAFLLGL